MSKTKTFTTKRIVFSGAAIALAIIVATFFKIKLPIQVVGGSITLFSMLLICLTGYWYGPVVGLSASLAYGILQFITGPYVIHPLQVVLDFPLAFGALGLSGFFHNAKNGLTKGYLAGAAGRFFFHCLSGIIFYTEYAGSFGSNAAAIWSGILYNMSYIVPEAVLTLILLELPPVKKAMTRLKRVAAE